MLLDLAGELDLGEGGMHQERDEDIHEPSPEQLALGRQLLRAYDMVLGAKRVPEPTDDRVRAMASEFIGLWAQWEPLVRQHAGLLGQGDASRSSVPAELLDVHGEVWAGWVWAWRNAEPVTFGDLIDIAIREAG